MQPQYVLVAGVTVLAATLLTLGLQRTIAGQALVACADSRRAAELVGINVRAVAVIAFAVSAALSALGWVLLTPVDPVNYDSDVRIAVNGFAAAAFGGLVEIRLALVGGLSSASPSSSWWGTRTRSPGWHAGAPVRARGGVADHARPHRLALSARGDRMSLGRALPAARPAATLAAAAFAIWLGYQLGPGDRSLYTLWGCTRSWRSGSRC